ncbi:hypothetical protein MMC22_004933 [Lobaria immixta]|nr:hypothetical protein [Lobaria immixta]
MDEISKDGRSLNLKRSDYSIDSTPTVAASPGSPVHHRPGCHRITSYKRAERESSDRDAQLESSSSFGIAGSGFGSSRGLGIGNVETRRPVAVGSKSDPSTPLSVDPLLSPSSIREGRNSPHVERHFEDERIHYGEHGRNGLNSTVFEPVPVSSDHERSHRRTASVTETHVEPFEFGYRAGQCRKHGRIGWLSITILALAAYSAVGSGLWFAVALIRPRWGRHVTTTGKISPATASLLCAALAKSIELSFVTIFVSFLGHVLSRKAVKNQSRGITIAEMSMRAWVMQPGTMITQWQTVRYAAFTFLGAISLFAALMSTLYTTASDALVAPKLKFGGTESRHIYGRVATQFANPDYIKSQCKTPIRATTDPVNSESTCIQIEHAGQSYHNYEQYLVQWTSNIDSGNGSAILGERPRPSAMLYDNTTVQGSWIHAQNITELSKNFTNRIINNVSMAMPHAGVFAAARDPLNNIIQPQDLSGLGEYVIRASVPSPVVNILCANLAKGELDPLVKTSWPNATLNATQWPEGHGLPDRKTWLDQNKTALDELFEI